MTTFRISGQIIDLHTRQGLFAVRVEAWDKDLICSDLVGSAVTDSQGVFQITFDESYFQELFGDRRPDIFFRVFRGDKLIKNTEDSVLWNVSSENIQIIIEIEENHEMNSQINFTVGVSFEGVTSDKQPPPASVYAFDANGKFLTSAPVTNNQAILSLPTATAGQVVRFVVGPHLEGKEPPKLAKLTRLEAYEKRLRVNPRHPSLNLKIIDSIWIHWLLCLCFVRGRVIKRVTLPDGTVQDWPICNARVTICEVDPWPIIILRLPDDILWRLRDELLNLVRIPLPIPPRPIPELAVQDLSSYSVLPSSNVSGVLAQPSSPRSALTTATETALQPMELQLTDVGLQNRILPIARIGSINQLRQELVNLADLIRPYICWWPWLHPFFYRLDCLPPVDVDENGRFPKDEDFLKATIFYRCSSDKPDVYFKVEQLQGGIWQTIYKPSIPCHTYWNYASGSEVVINVTDPSAIACVPNDNFETPAGVETWVMPFAVGGTKIWGTPPSAAAAPAGWVKSDGKTDYTDSISGLSFVNAPFGGYLGFRHSYSSNINGDAAGSNIQYYRWSYRKAANGQWKQMDIPVFKYYVKQKPAQLPSFPVYKLGPNTVGTSTNLFQFRPSVPPADPTDPAGTITEWPTDSSLGDIYSAFLNSLTLSPGIADAAGQYQIKLEIFDTAGNLVTPGAGTFQFILPAGVAGDGTIYTRSVQPSELDAGGFVFNLHIDNNSCTATIDPPNIGGTAVADVCGFLRYDPASPTLVNVSFHARHPNNFAEFSFQIVRGPTELVVAQTAAQEVDAGMAGPYRGDGVGNFTNNFNRSDLLCGTNNVKHPVDPKHCCVNAAFAEYLYVYAKATTGWGSRIAADDASALRAFALAPNS